MHRSRGGFKNWGGEVIDFPSHGASTMPTLTLGYDRGHANYAHCGAFDAPSATINVLHFSALGIQRMATDVVAGAMAAGSIYTGVMSVLH